MQGDGERWCRPVGRAGYPTTSSLIENAVANDLRFGPDLTAIVITGPNTGGKTIMLRQ